MKEETTPSLKPCPHCGEHLVLKGDHHGEWWGHRNDIARCLHSITQIVDDDDFQEWNRRAA